jgi:AcrR family transcriptional regulator
MGVKQRRQKEHAALRELILNTASEMFANEGYKNVSMRKIAEKIEYSPTTIYLYFRDKNHLLGEICDETFAKLVKKLDEITRKENDELKSLKKGLKAYIEFGLEHPNHYEVTFIKPPVIGEIGDSRSFETSLGARAFNYMKQGVIEAMNAGKIRRGNVDLISQTLWAGIHGITSLLIGHKKFPFVDKERLINNMINTLVNGIV